MDPADQDIKRHGIEESKYQKAYECLFDKSLRDETILEAMMLDEYPDDYSEIDSLPKFHKTMLWLYFNQVDIPYVKRWLEYVDRETERRIL